MNQQHSHVKLNLGILFPIVYQALVEIVVHLEKYQNREMKEDIGQHFQGLYSIVYQELRETVVQLEELQNQWVNCDHCLQRLVDHYSKILINKKKSIVFYEMFSGL